MYDTIADAVRAMGPVDDGLVFQSESDQGKVNFFTLDEIGMFPPTRRTPLYVASGTFKAGTVNRYAGRTTENVERVLWIVLDCDGKDWLVAKAGYEPAESKQALLDMNEEERNDVIDSLTTDVLASLGNIGVSAHRIVRSGYGVQALVHLGDGVDVHRCRSINAGIVDALNRAAGFAICDPRCKDAGTRVSRVPGSLNAKRSDRPVVVTISTPGLIAPDPYTLDDLARFDVRKDRVYVRPAAIPADSLLPAGIEDALAQAIRPEWVEGQRHGLSLAISGILAGAGVREDDTERLVYRLVDQSGDTYTDDFIRCVRTTYANIRGGRQTTGWYALNVDFPDLVQPVRDALGPLGVYRSPVVFPGEGGVVSSSGRSVNDDSEPE